MPIYEYECRKCNAHIEIMQKMTDKPLAKCTKCGGRLEKQWSSTSFHLKGTGWYVTDYAAKKSEPKVETKEGKSTTTEDKTNKGDEKTSKGDEKTSKGDDKSTATKPDTTTTEKSSSTSRKSTSKNASSNTSGD